MFADPIKNIEQMGLLPGMYVADLGSGSGHYTLEAGKAVGNQGRVYSIDIQKDLLSKVKNLATREHLHNVEIIWGDIEKIGGTRLKDSSVDAVIASNILFQIPNKDIFAKEVKRILKKNGKLLVVDWSDSFGGLGPKSEDVVTKNKAVEIFGKEGFVEDRPISAGAHHYGVIFIKNSQNSYE